MTNEFAVLPNEIINDIVELAGVERNERHARIHHQHLVQLNGPWGDFARHAAPIMLISNKIVTRNCKGFTYAEDTPLTFEEAGNRAISHCEIAKNVDVNVLIKAAPHLNESIEFRGPKIPGDVLDLLGDRFSWVKWSRQGYSPLAIENEMIKFLKRQLRSEYLRTFIFCSNYIEDEEFTNLFIEFVKKPTFKSLIGLDMTYISAQVFLAADQSWRSRSSFEVGTQEIGGLVMLQSMNALQAKVEIAWDGASSIPHPTVPSASQLVIALSKTKQANAYYVTATFSNKFVE